MYIIVSSAYLLQISQESYHLHKKKIVSSPNLTRILNIIFFLLLKGIESNLIIHDIRICKLTCLLKLICKARINTLLLQCFADMRRCRVEKTLSQPTAGPHKGKPGDLWPSCCSAHTLNKHSFCGGLFSVRLFTFL